MEIKESKGFAEMPLRKARLYHLFAFAAAALLFIKIVIHLHFYYLPLFFLALGSISYFWKGKKALILFLFLLPLINSSPDLFFNGYPFNYMAVSLFYLAGIILAGWLKRERKMDEFPGSGIYLLFLALLFISALFVFLRWSNLTMSWLGFFRDTPVTPSGQRLSFASMFPVITLALFSLSPFLFFLIRRYELKEAEIFRPLMSGFSFSFLLALFQLWVANDFLTQGWWVSHKNQVNGGFSDFNAFGFFSGVLFLYYALHVIQNKPAAAAEKNIFNFSCVHSGRLNDIFFLVISLAAIFISGCRTAFLFVLLTLIYLFFSKNIGLLYKLAVVFLLVIALFSVGGTMKRRLGWTLSQIIKVDYSAVAFEAKDDLSNGRLNMLKDSAKILARFPASGIGAGNFLFYFKYMHFGDYSYEDLPLNQYLLIANETGLIGGMVFVLFLALLLTRQRQGKIRFVLAAIAFALLFNNYFWFPEILLLFWIIIARSDLKPVVQRRRWTGFALAFVFIFAFFNVLDFQALHPQAWAMQKGTAYDYGFWPVEKNDRGSFAWTGKSSGKFYPAGLRQKIVISCGSPAEISRVSRVVVRLFWRGKLFKKMIFSERQNQEFRLPERQAGFLEIRVQPTFNLKAMGLSSDSRDLGVQVYEHKELP